MNIKRIIAGIVHWWDESILLRSLARRIDVSYDNGLTFTKVGRISLDPVRNAASRFRLGRRLARTNIKHALRLQNELFLVFAGKRIFHVDASQRTILHIANIVGSRPLRVCHADNSIYYGEYRSNPERSPIHIWRSQDSGKTWDVAFRFTGIRHVHGIFKDPYEDSFWVTTGDENDEAAIWRADADWKTVEPVLSGSQQTRVIDLIFERDSIYFGTDAPHEPNWIYQWHRNSDSFARLQQVNGTVFHAAKFGDQVFFSTCIEPGRSRHGRDVELWAGKREGASSGTLRHELVWKRIATFRKDIWPMKYFEYGQILLPAGTLANPHGAIWISPYATIRDQQSLLIDIECQ